ncbi:hypothetical protein [uncultured Gimesia sp.]|jgi:hypothetical protein|uniref:hypothetical protein n=1 Tax=uncultured Gimesia sp. TaxID=1678688 RepID=UPI00261FB6F1|nr:hypothetical protein [uncultured Gimesia sp.]
MCYRLITVIFVLTQLCSLAVSEELDPSEKNSSLDQLIAISNNVDLQLRSYKAEGRFREYDIIDDDFQLTKDAQITANCSGARYYLNLEFTSHNEAEQRRVILFDGSTLATSRFSPKISVTGAGGDLFPARASRAGIVSPQIASFPWDISHLQRELCCLPLVIENLGRDRLSCSKTMEGDLKAGYLVGKSGKAGKVSLVFRKKDGFHLSCYHCENPQGKLMKTNDLDWINIDGVWCVKKMVEVSFIANKKWELEFKSISPNVMLDEKTFALEALDLPARSRIIDRGQQTRFIRVAP